MLKTIIGPGQNKLYLMGPKKKDDLGLERQNIKPYILLGHICSKHRTGVIFITLNAYVKTC